MNLKSASNGTFLACARACQIAMTPSPLSYQVPLVMAMSTRVKSPSETAETVHPKV